MVTEGRPGTEGHAAARELRKHGIPVTLICDGAVGYIMEQVDLVLLGAEGIVENGGIINKVGSYQIAIVAEAMQRPVYVAAECFKFARVFPLNQQGGNTRYQILLICASPLLLDFHLDVHPVGRQGIDQNVLKPTIDTEDVHVKIFFKSSCAAFTKNVFFQVQNPVRDYTPPQFITLLFTDLGVLTPSAVSDELVKLHA